MQHFLKPTARATRTRIIASELFGQFLVAAHDAYAAFDLRFGREALTPFAHGFAEKTVLLYFQFSLS